jgi:CHASE3 domain sensor protein
MRVTWVQKLSIGTGAALGLLALTGFVSYVSINQMMRGQSAVAETNRNIARLDAVVGRTVDAENAQRGFVTTGDEEYLEPLGAAVSDVEDAIQALMRATEETPEQRRNLDSLAPMVSRRFKEINAVIAVRSRAGLDSAAAMIRTQNAVRGRDGIGPIAAKMREQELRELGERTRTMTASGETALRMVLGASVLALLLALFALQLLRPSVERRLTSRLSGASPEAATAPPPLAEVDAALHRRDRLVRLQQVVAALNGPATASEVAQALLTRGAAPLVASLGVMVLRDASALTVVQALGDAAPGLAAGAVVPPDLTAPFADSFRARETVVVGSSVERSERFPALSRFAGSGMCDGAFVVVPLTDDDQSYGALLLAFAGDRVFTDEDRAYLATLGRLGGQALARVAVPGI